MAFRYQAIDASGQTLIDTIEAGSTREAADMLRTRGLFVTKITQAEDNNEAGPTSGSAKNTEAGGKLRDVVLFAQQMSMMLRAGAQITQALEAIESQTPRNAWRSVIQSLRTEVEEGRPLSQALLRFPKLFQGVFFSMVAAGEASGDLPLAFTRLAKLTRQQYEIRQQVIGAMSYPLVLMVLCIGVLTAMFTFVLPRFAEMFDTLGADLPKMTSMMISFSQWIHAHWLLTLTAVSGSIMGSLAFFQSPTGDQLFSQFLIRIPLFGKIVRNVTLARICRIWGLLLESKVEMLESVNLTKQSTKIPEFKNLLTEIEEALTGGSAIGPPLKNTWLVPNTFAAAMVTGEESGKLADSLLFVASCLEEDNAQVLASLARIIEPIMLVIMGVIVGTLAISLFLPMFDTATIAGR